MAKYFVACVACLALVIALSADPVLPADKINYSGMYSLQKEKTSSGNDTESTLEVVHKEDSVEITKVQEGKRMISRCPLNGSEGDYISRAGTSGKCKAQLKGKDLQLEWTAMTLPPPEPMRGKELWQFSAEAKTLTIKTDIFMSKGIHIVMSEKYIRTENP